MLALFCGALWYSVELVSSGADKYRQDWVQYADQLQSHADTLDLSSGIGGVQLIMGNYIDPLMQGIYLALSPLVVLFSVVFWGWLWEIAGAFMGVPLTVGIVITCRQFERTRWIAVLLASRDANAVPGENNCTKSSC